MLASGAEKIPVGAIACTHASVILRPFKDCQTNGTSASGMTLLTITGQGACTCKGCELSSTLYVSASAIAYAGDIWHRGLPIWLRTTISHRRGLICWAGQHDSLRYGRSGSIRRTAGVGGASSRQRGTSSLAHRTAACGCGCRRIHSVLLRAQSRTLCFGGGVPMDRLCRSCDYSRLRLDHHRASLRIPRRKGRRAGPGYRRMVI